MTIFTVAANSLAVEREILRHLTAYSKDVQDALCTRDGEEEVYRVTITVEELPRTK